MDAREIAKLAYEAYCESTGGVSLITGAKLPSFEILNEEIKLAWVAAACAVAEHTMNYTKDLLRRI